MRSILSALAVAALAGFGAGCARSGAEPAPAQPRLHVRVAPVSVETVSRPVPATGILGPKEEIALGFKVGGIIGDIRVDEGAAVRAGETLATLDLTEIDAAVSRARSEAEKAARDAERMKRLHADSVVTTADLEDAETRLEIARAGLEAAEFNRRHAVIVAPSSGVILHRRAERGELVSPGAPVITLGTDAGGMVLRAALADRDRVRIALGDSAAASFDALPGETFAGRVIEIASAADPATGTYQAEIRLAGASRLASGMIGRALIRPAASRPVSLVPVEALVEADGQRASVYSLAPRGDTVERRDVVIAFLDGDRVAIASGLDAVSQVVTDGAARLDSGDAVMVVR